MAAARLVPIAPFFHPELNTYLPDRVLSFTRDAVSKTLRAFRRKRVARHSPYPNDSPPPNLPSSPNPTLPLHATQHSVQEALFIGFAMNKALSIWSTGRRFCQYQGERSLLIGRPVLLSYLLHGFQCYPRPGGVCAWVLVREGEFWGYCWVRVAFRCFCAVLAVFRNSVV
jgi:hypothetical protein